MATGDSVNGIDEFTGFSSDNGESLLLLVTAAKGRTVWACFSL
jgi:hypothetical protein